jgi:hypothetical protein
MLQYIKALNFTYKAIQTEEFLEQCHQIEQIKYREENQPYKAFPKYGIVQNPNYPLKYDKNIDCVFLIHGKLNLFVYFFNFSF